MAAADPTASAFIRRIGDYDVDILNELGQGAWGTVYKGRHKDRKTAVAAKKMRLDPKVPEARDLVRNESELLLKVKNHPYLLKIHHAQFIDQPYLKFHEFWIITSFCRQGNLSEYCMTHILSLKEKLRISRQTAAGLAFLHNLKPCIIHRDLKPENIFLDIVDGDLTAKLGDFGLARNMEHTFLTTIGGTQSYLAPEIWPWSQGRRVQFDEKIDTFALGLVHGLVLRQKTKKPLHELGSSVPLGQQMVIAVETNKPLPVAIVIEKTDDEMTVKWKGLILQMTAYDPNQRPSMEHVEEELAAMQEDLVEKMESTSSGSIVTSGDGSKMFSSGNVVAAAVARFEEKQSGSRDLGLCARVLYDYMALNEDEISIGVGAIITDINEQTGTEGWWRGVAPNGKEGMFPNNFVERLPQQSQGFLTCQML